MKIVYLIHGLFNTGGMERVLTSKANYLADKLEHEVHIITRSQCGRENAFPLSNNVIQHDLNLDYSGVTARNPMTIIKKLPFLVRHFLKLRSMLLQIKPDITVSMYGNEFIFLPNIHDGSKKVIEYHFSLYAKTIGKNATVNKSYQKLRLALIKYLARRYDKLITLTEKDRKMWGGQENSMVIANPMTLENASPSTNLASKRVVSAGRYTYQKGFDRLINVWKNVHNIHPDWELVIYGQGEDKEKLQHEINKFGLEKQIILHPVSKNLAEEYKNASFFVSSSRYEGFPLVIFEAMACGLPVISFDYPCGPSEMISDNEDGLLVEDNNETKLCEVICKMIENPSMRTIMSRNAVKKAKRYDITEIMKIWESLFLNLIN